VVAGARLATQDEAVGDRRYRSEPRCFASPAAGDLLGPAGGKVLGSAARTRGARILVHGSLKLASNPWDGPAVVGCGLDEAAAARALLEGFAAALGQELPEPQIPTPAETTAMESLRAARYGDRAWVERREGLRP
jgi:lipoate-protein ligase A